MTAIATTYKFRFEDSRKPKGDCPQCGHKRVFRYYEGVPREYGKCERLNNCGFHNKPTQSIEPKELPQIVVKPQVYVDAEKVEKWLKNHTSPFHTWARGLGVTDEHLQKWLIGTTERGETVFVHQDTKGQFTTAKFIAYTEGGSRRKDVDSYYMKSPKDGRYCVSLFGEHLLGVDATKTVCTVESEKTAVLGSFFYPEFDFVATGSCNGLTDEKVGALVGRKVYNLRDADIAGRSTCSLKKLESCKTPLRCQGCKVPAIEKRLAQWNIEHKGLDLFPTKEDGYDLADAIRDGNAQPYAIQLAAEIENNSYDGDDDEDDSDFISRLVQRVPNGMNADEFIKNVTEYGFYEHKNRYWMQRKDMDFENVSNFVMQVEYLIVGVNAKRIVKLTNVHKKTVVIDFGIEDLISKAKFQARIEAVGNFLFEGKDSDLSRIKNKLYNLEKAAKEISTLGYHKDGFWAWANGLYDGQKFNEIDQNGMVEWNKEHYYIPVFGATTDADDDSLRNNRKFCHRNTEGVNFETWAKQFVTVFGDNGKMAIAFYLVAMFRDIVQKDLNFTPMLFLFGQRGSGKSELVKSLLNLWGEPQDPIMLGGSSTPVAFMRKLSQFQNGVTWFDEYKNDIPTKLIESIKNVWDGIGYERGAKDNSNKTHSSQIKTAAIVSGQEMPNIEPAMFSRFVLLEFAQTKYTTEAIAEFNKLKRMQNDGLTNVTHEIFNYREKVKTEFKKRFDEIAEILRTAFGDSDVIERQTNNMAALCAMVWVLSDKIELPFTHVQLIKLSEKIITAQKAMMKTANEIQQFWEMVGFLWQSSMITEGLDFQFKDVKLVQNTFKTEYTEGFVMIRLSTIYPLYREYSRRQGLKSLDKGTLIRYFNADASFSKVESDKSHRFEKIANPTNAFVFLQTELCRIHNIDVQDFRPSKKTAIQEPQNIDNQVVAF